MATTREQARRLARRGRYGDSELVHISPEELLGLQAMHPLTVNPDTGLPEAFSLGNVFKSIAGPLLGFAIGGPAGAALGAGAGSLIQGGSPIDALKSAGLGYLGSSVFSGLTGAEGGGLLSNLLGEGTSWLGDIASSTGGGISNLFGGGGGAAGSTGIAPWNAGPGIMADILGTTAGGAATTAGGGGMADLIELLRKAGMIPGGGPISGALNIGSGIYGLTQASQLRKLAEQAMRTQDPFGPYRAGYAADLATLRANPESITSRPGYQAGIQAVTRGMASKGYGGWIDEKTGLPTSGNLAVALQKYGGDAYNQEETRLAQLAGAQFPPTGGQALLTGNIAASNLASRALASLGYGARGIEKRFPIFA